MSRFPTADDLAALWGRSSEAALAVQGEFLRDVKGWWGAAPAPPADGEVPDEPAVLEAHPDDAAAARSEALAASAAALAAVEEIVGRDAAPAARLRKALDPASWLPRGDLPDAPGQPSATPSRTPAPTWRGEGIAREIGAVRAGAAAFRDVADRHSRLLLRACTDAADAFASEIRMPADGERLPGPALPGIWEARLADAQARLARTPSFRESLGALLAAAASLGSARREAADTLARAFGLPGRSEVDGLQAEIAGLRRELRAARPAGHEGGSPASFRGAGAPPPIAGDGQLRPVEVQDAGAVLLVPGLFGQRETRQQSRLVEALTQRGLAVQALDWGAPGRADRFLTLADYVDCLAQAATRTMRGNGGTPPHLVGLGDGGILALCCAALQPSCVAGVALLSTAVDRSRGAGPPSDGWVQALSAENLDRLVDAADVLSEWFGGSFPSSPPQAGAPEWAEFHLSSRPGAALREWLAGIVAENRLVRGGLVLSGRVVDLARVACPILDLLDEGEAEPVSAALGNLVGSEDYREIRLPRGLPGTAAGDARAERFAGALLDWMDGRPARGAVER